jgi:hypothetical protein
MQSVWVSVEGAYPLMAAMDPKTNDKRGHVPAPRNATSATAARTGGAGRVERTDAPTPAPGHVRASVSGRLWRAS